MTEGEYSTADIEVLEFDESVRHWPGMFFGVSLDDPRLPTNVVRVGVDHAIHPTRHLAALHTPVVDVEILGDLFFSITDDQFCAAEGCRVPDSGYFGSLLGPDRWMLAAAAALSRRTTVKVWQDGRGLRQELAGLRPIGQPESFTGPRCCGTTVTIELDPGRLRPDVAIDTNLETIGLCRADDCATAPRCVTVNDRRNKR
ncbi:hypothetical protein [Amycolatopsis sp. BJA-103]|uniref:hypothetical protein n=1 Tax=Amycolatopsis sp. BJA-103 TaxID=1911175 RepID=UPI000C75A3D8|nr:hypothetical protein [Amycolatopsis sp. BJA-103]AUI57321.1 hypothetical protein BKN51_03225 [Amycolatopsis sp. BJA-103]PNE13251.1 hypothetical protein B1H26_41400 [Amycolatopsis sp. BJA-103]